MIKETPSHKALQFGMKREDEGKERFVRRKVLIGLLGNCIALGDCMKNHFVLSFLLFFREKVRSAFERRDMS